MLDSSQLWDLAFPWNDIISILILHPRFSYLLLLPPLVPPHVVLAMPALSPTMERGTLASWAKKVGDHVRAGDVLAQVETDKAVVSFDSTEDGYLAKILVEGGTSDVAVGTPVAIFVEDEESVAAFKDYKVGDEATPSAAPAASTPKPAESTPTPAPSSAPSSSAPASSSSAPSASAGENGRVFASPAARALAREKGVNIHDVLGTGPNRRIIKADVQEFTPSKATAASTSAAPTAAPTPVAKTVAAPSGGDYADVPLSQVRKVIAQRLSQSKQTIPHYYVTVEVEMDAILKLRAELNKQLEAAAKASGTDPVKLSVNDFVIKATAAALRKVPAVNASWQDSFIRNYNYVDISVAVSTEGGLITPIVADADIKGLTSISADMKSLAKKARENKLQPHEFQGGTFTVSNLGMFGVTNFSAIINPPQAGILAVGGTSAKVVPVPGASSDAPQFKTVQVMNVTASFDHRVVDGAVGAQWLAAFKGFCEKPATMLL